MEITSLQQLYKNALITSVIIKELTDNPNDNCF